MHLDQAIEELLPKLIVFSPTRREKLLKMVPKLNDLRKQKLLAILNYTYEKQLKFMQDASNEDPLFITNLKSTAQAEQVKNIQAQEIDPDKEAKLDAILDELDSILK